MSEMVERVAKALEKLPIRDNANRGGELDRLRLREATRAAIEAMREPTRGMIDAAPIDIPVDQQVIETWQTMIDAALGKVDA